MPETTEYLKKLIAAMGFTPQDGKSDVFFKTYAAHNGYTIFVDFNEQKIEYVFLAVPTDERIRLGDATTSSFQSSENFVVLECIDRLLEKGYKPGCIELEKKYPLGRNLKGKLDILIYNGDVPFLMIECKTWGTEFEKEAHKMLKDGGQLFSYYAQDRFARYLCLYTSHLDHKNLEYLNNIVIVQDAWRELSSTKDIHDYWNKTFKDNGVFEYYAAPYSIKHKALTYGMLKNLKEEDSGKIFNQIMEILRHNAISDKPNAFNKLLNLFVCKIIDENSNPDDELKFQWLEIDDDESLQMRLNDLYKEGMWRFLEIKIIDHSEEEVSAALEGIDDIKKKQQLKGMFRDARLKKSPNFAFIEVLDDKTFMLNAKIVREVIELLQPYKFRYEQKHEFLGNFFELLLNTSMKQEAGQFFTPVPITRFIISSLPLQEFVQGKIDNREHVVLPAVIDYACGSGHFLTEYMEQMQKTIDKKIDVSKALPDVRGLIQSIKFAWAKDTVYGIDLDNRLVKTTKVSAFFNGDGEANIIWANGLDNFEKTEEYRGLLRNTLPYEKKNNGQFDILISNPPYSVEAFKSTLKYGEETFDLYDHITDNSSEIECLFVERMKQLLRVGGWAGVILPSSILSNGGIYSKARGILLKYFKFKSIVELGSGTFMKTGTNTVVLFLERRADSDYANVSRAIERFFNDQQDVTVLGIENAFSHFVANAYDDLAFEDYLSFICGTPNECMIKHELYLDYIKAFGNDHHAKVVALEKEKMMCFLLTYPQNIVLIKAGKKEEEKAFLGYEFSERRGHEGMKWLPGGTKLYDETGNLQNPKKANSYIYNVFLDNVVAVDESLSRNVSYGRMSGFVSYGTSKFDKIINLKRKSRGIIDSKYPQGKLGNDLIVLFDSQRKPVTKSDRSKGPYPYYGSTGIIDYVAEYIFDGRYVLLGEDGAKWGSDENSAFIVDGKCWINNHAHVIRTNSNLLIDSYLVYVLNKLDLSYYITGEVNVPKLNQGNLLDIRIPLPPLEIQHKIVAEMRAIEEEEITLQAKVQAEQFVITNVVDGCFNSGFIMEQLGNIAQIFNGGTPKTDKPEYWSGGICWATLVDTKTKYLTSTQRQITQLGLDSCNATVLPVNTVLFSSRATIGDVSIAKIEVATNQGYKNFVCADNTLYYEYLYYILQHEAKNIESLASGMTYPEISKTMISSYKIPLPTYVEQKEIVARIEQREAEISRLNECLKKLKASNNSVLKKYLC
jgi:type I restriction enzyme M protein